VIPWRSARQMILLDEQMNYEYVVHEMVDGEAE